MTFARQLEMRFQGGTPPHVSSVLLIRPPIGRPVALDATPDPAIAERIAMYTPRSVPADRWEHIAPFVRQVVIDANPATLAAAERAVRVVGQLVKYAVDCHLGLDRDMILSPDFVGRFVFHLEQAGRPASTIGTYHSTLRRLAPQVTTTAPWPPVLEHPRTNTPRPYSAETIDAFLRNAKAQTTLLRTNRALVIISLAAGAGLRPSEIRAFAGRDLSEDGRVVVSAGHKRKVPVDRPLLDSLREGIADSHDRIFSDHKNALNGVTRSLRFDPTLPTFDLRRLRNTWIDSRLEELSALDLMHQSGLASVRVIDDLVRMRTGSTE